MTSTSNAPLRRGDFTGLAGDYARFRPGYSLPVRDALLRITGARTVADVGAGTGIWTRLLAEAGLSCRAVEPNDDMRAEGVRHTEGLDVVWRRGAAEETGLPDASVDWVTMASSFHWTDAPRALAEFHRILRPGGWVTVLWNPRDIDGNPLHEAIEALVHEAVPELERVSSGRAKHTRDWTAELQASGHFEDVVFLEARHEIAMTHERYLGVWRSVNDIQAQAGPERFARLLDRIAGFVRPLDGVTVPYKTRAWVARRRDGAP